MLAWVGPPHESPSQKTSQKHMYSYFRYTHTMSTGAMVQIRSVWYVRTSPKNQNAEGINAQCRLFYILTLGIYFDTLFHQNCGSCGVFGSCWRGWRLFSIPVCMCKGSSYTYTLLKGSTPFQKNRPPSDWYKFEVTCKVCDSKCMPICTCMYVCSWQSPVLLMTSHDITVSHTPYTH